ncbi:MAG: hypothetical protein RL077_3680 [Verrucomicrobiota bacterium]
MADAHIAGVDEGTDLEKNAIAVLQGGNHGPGITAAEEVALQRGEGPRQITAEESLGGLEKIALGDVGRELGDVGFLNDGALSSVGGEFVGLFDDESSVGADFGEEHFDGAWAEGGAEYFGLGEGDAEQGLARIFAVAADQREVGIFFAPLGEGAPAIDGGRRDQEGRIGGIDARENVLELLNEFQGALGSAGDGVGHKINVFEPNDTFTAKHGDGLDGVAELIDGCLDLGDISGEAIEGFTGKLVGDLGCHGGKAGLAGTPDEKIIGSADKSEVFRQIHAQQDSGDEAVTAARKKSHLGRARWNLRRNYSMTSSPKENHAPPAPWGRDLGLLLILFGALYFLMLGRHPLSNPDESRYAEIPREMMVRGDWVTPRLNDVPYFEKPPLVYWMVGLSQKLFGPGEVAARLTPTLFGLAGVLMTYVAGRRLYGRAAGVGAAVVLGTSLLYFVLSRILLLDMVVSVLMSGTLFCFILGVREATGARRRGWFYGLYICAAGATLAKGLIGFMVPGAVMFFWLLVFNQWQRLRPFYLPSGLVIFLALAAPWHVLAAQRNPGWAQFYFIHEHWERFTTTTHNRAEPFWYFVPVILLGFFPWVGFLAGSVREAVVGGWARRRENAEAWFLVTWFVFVFLFFSKSQSKLIPYILPLFPPMAVLVGRSMARRWGEVVGEPFRVGLVVFGVSCGLLAVALLTAVFKSGVIRDPGQAESLRPFGLAMAGWLLVGGTLTAVVARVWGRAGGAALGGVTLVGFYGVALLAAPALQRASTGDLALVARERMMPADRVYHYWGFFHDFVYFTGRPVGLVSYTDELEVQFLEPAERAARFIDDAELRRQWAEARRVWLVVRKKDQRRPTTVFADQTLRYHLIAENADFNLLSNQP